MKKKEREQYKLEPFVVLTGYRDCEHWRHYIAITNGLVKCTRCGVLIVLGLKVEKTDIS